MWDRAGGRDRDPEGMKTRRVPSPHTHRRTRTQMRLNEEFSAAGARPRSEPRPLGGQHQIKFCVERSREAPLPLARSQSASVVFKEAKTNPTPGPKRQVELITPPTINRLESVSVRVCASLFLPPFAGFARYERDI